MAAFLSVTQLLQNHESAEATPRTDGQLAPRTGLLDVVRSRDARHRLRVLLSAQKVAAWLDRRAEGGMLTAH